MCVEIERERVREKGRGLPMLLQTSLSSSLTPISSGSEGLTSKQQHFDGSIFFRKDSLLLFFLLYKNFKNRLFSIKDQKLRETGEKKSMVAIRLILSKS